MRLFFNLSAGVAGLAAAVFVAIPAFSASDIGIAIGAMLACLFAAECATGNNHG